MKNTKLFILLISILFIIPSQLAGQCTLPANFLGGQQIVCGSHTLGPVAGLSNYMWNSSPTDTFSTYNATLTGLHWVEGTDSFGNVCRDTVTLFIQPLPIVDLGPDWYFCGERDIDLCFRPIGPWGGPPPIVRPFYFDSSSLSFLPLPPSPCYHWIDSTTTFLIEIEFQNGCVSVDTFVIFFNETMTLHPVIYPDLGNGKGAAKVDVIGGQAPLEYSWDWGSNWGNLDSLGGLPGGYNGRIYARDATNCTTMVIFSIPLEEAVFPGDCDYDGRVTMCDLFPIGLHFGETGPMRLNASLNWQPQISPLWNLNQANGYDLQHADTDGNGHITWDDTLAILQNFDSTHSNQSPIRAGEGVPIYVNWRGGIYQTGDTVHASIMIGKPDTMIFNLLGIAFDLELDANLIDLSSVEITSQSNWLGSSGIDMIHLKRENRFFGEYEFGMVKNDLLPKTGFGSLAQLRFVLGSAPVSGEIPLQITFGQVKAIDHQGVEIELNPQDGKAMISSTASISPDISASITVFPNPSQGIISLAHPGISPLTFTLFNTTGQQLPIQPQISNQATTIDLSLYPPGIYWLEGKTEKAQFRKRILLIP